MGWANEAISRYYVSTLSLSFSALNPLVSEDQIMVHSTLDGFGDTPRTRPDTLLSARGIVSTLHQDWSGSLPCFLNYSGLPRPREPRAKVPRVSAVGSGRLGTVVDMVAATSTAQEAPITLGMDETWTTRFDSGTIPPFRSQSR